MRSPPRRRSLYRGRHFLNLREYPAAPTATRRRPYGPAEKDRLIFQPNPRRPTPPRLHGSILSHPAPPPYGSRRHFLSLREYPAATAPSTPPPHPRAAPPASPPPLRPCHRCAASGPTALPSIHAAGTSPPAPNLTVSPPPRFAGLLHPMQWRG
jgi:hypothetical protein